MEKTFYAQDFEVRLNLKKTGKLIGILKKLNVNDSISYEIDGFYLDRADEITFIAFMRNKVLVASSADISAFHGAIRSHDGCAYLVLDWVTYSENSSEILEKEITSHSRILLEEIREIDRKVLPTPIPKLEFLGVSDN